MKINIWQKLWYFVWMASESSGIGLGRFAPWVFHQTIGCDKKCKKVEDER